MTADQDIRCTFTFRDGRRCSMLICKGHPTLCLYHRRQFFKQQEAAAKSRAPLTPPGTLDNRRAIRRTLKRVIGAITDGRLTIEQARVLAEIGRLLMVYTRRTRKPRRNKTAR